MVSFRKGEKRYQMLDMRPEELKRGTSYVWTDIGQHHSARVQWFGLPFDHVVERTAGRVTSLWIDVCFKNFPSVGVGL